MEVYRANNKSRPAGWDAILASIPGVKKVVECRAGEAVFCQGQPADSVFYLRQGKVTLTVESRRRKHAIVGILGAGDFLGEGCLAGQKLRISTASAITDCILDRFNKRSMVLTLNEHHAVSKLFVKHLLERIIRYEQDLVHQLFSSSEKRLARTLLMLAHFGKESRAETIVPGINQESLAQMVGTTRSRISHFMNKFRKLGFVDYNGQMKLTVNSSLLSVVLHD
jgi:CRP-like cAMP-binding protein